MKLIKSGLRLKMSETTFTPAGKRLNNTRGTMITDPQPRGLRATNPITVGNKS